MSTADLSLIALVPLVFALLTLAAWIELRLAVATPFDAHRMFERRSQRIEDDLERERVRRQEARLAVVMVTMLSSAVGVALTAVLVERLLDEVGYTWGAALGVLLVVLCGRMLPVFIGGLPEPTLDREGEREFNRALRLGRGLRMLAWPLLKPVEMVISTFPQSRRRTTGAGSGNGDDHGHGHGHGQTTEHGSAFATTNATAAGMGQTQATVDGHATGNGAPSNGHGDSRDSRDGRDGRDGDDRDRDRDRDREREWDDDHDDENQIDEDEAEMITGVLRLDQVRARDIMVPRPDIVALPSDALVDHAVEVAIQRGHSRIPVYGRDLDDIIGVLYAKDMLPYVNERDSHIPIEGKWRAASFVPDSKPVDGMLEDMRDAQVHLAIVVDEFGGTSGLVTIEDILEEIVGEIRDEFDRETPAIQPVPERNDAWFIDGRITVTDLVDELRLDWPDTPGGTLGGYLQRRVGGLPKEKDVVEVDGLLRLTVMRVDRRRVRLVLAEEVRSGEQSDGSRSEAA